MDIKTDYRLPPAITASDTKTPKQVTAEQPAKNAETVRATAREERTGTVELNSAAAALERDTLQEAVANMQDFTQNIQRSLSFSINESTGRTVVEVTDKATGDVIRQLPTEEALRLAESLEEMRSLLFTAQA
ncbi:flagellar protein FlaG [Pseudomonas sp. C27(2019)]|uniref:flagellar protein FlaG n=1 Tax=Pseudomonas sp. C27(2019) TaxID=2604941 RepID=UPI0012472B0B|nr:flagellar protein FlaG [Pseudomonas sp. C27(2019)]QEY59172.1 flagellar protein FlaG [Pseudomonas sp. C27(2019)]